jgi:hypothetical protein
MLADGHRHRPPFPVVGPAAIAIAGTCRATSACRRWLWRQGPPPTAVSQHAGVGDGGKSLPDLAQAACDTCRLARRAATETWSFLTIFFAGGSFWRFTRTDGHFRQNFLKTRELTAP